MADELFRDRGRAESFGSIAEVYDRLRPAPAPAFVDELVALAPETVLDVGCGTGKVAREFSARGLEVLGVELDERMAAIARGTASRSSSGPSRTGTRAAAPSA